MMMTTPARPEKRRARDSWRALRQLVRDQAAIDRTGIVPAVRVSKVDRIVAWIVILALYLIGWGIGIRNAFAILLGWVPLPETRPAGTVADLVVTISISVAVSVAAGILIVVFRRRAAARPWPVAWRTRIKTFPVAIAATLAGFLAVAVVSEVLDLPRHSFGIEQTTDPLGTVLTVIDAGMAGPSEELVMVALVVVALRATGHSWATVLLTSMLLRVPFHMYYGWGAVGLSVWALLIVLLYKRTGAISAIILAHTTFNVVNYLPDVVGASVKIGLAVLGVGVVWWQLMRLSAQQREDRQAAPRPAGEL